MKKFIKYGSVFVFIVMLLSLTGCASLMNTVTSLRGSLIGNSFDIKFYDNYGTEFLKVNGSKVDIDGIKMPTINFDSEGNLIRGYELSSAIDITIDGKQMISCGESALFVDKDLIPIELNLPETIESNSEAITAVSKNINKIKNSFGKPTIIIVCSQMGNPIAVYQGDSVNIKFPEDLPKFTKFNIDNKPLYLHRFNYFQVDTALIE